MQVAQPAPTTKGSWAAVKVFTWAGARCVLNDNQTTAKLNAAGGWMTWTFQVNTAGTFTMKVWCSKGTVGAALAKSLTVNNPPVKSWKNELSYSGYGDWVGPSVNLGYADHRIVWNYRCDTDSFGLAFNDIEWIGAESYATTFTMGQSGSGIYDPTKEQFADSGFFAVTNQGDCAWSFTVQAWR